MTFSFEIIVFFFSHKPLFAVRVFCSSERTHASSTVNLKMSKVCSKGYMSHVVEIIYRGRFLLWYENGLGKVSPSFPTNSSILKHRYSCVGDFVRENWTNTEIKGKLLILGIIFRSNTVMTEITSTFQTRSTRGLRAKICRTPQTVFS